MGRKTILTIQILFVSLFVMLLITFLFTKDIIITESNDQASVVTGEIGDVEDGTYTGSGKGFNGPIEVEVTIEDGVIADIEILNHSETEGLSDPAFEEVVAAIIAGNTTDVDVTSGATLTSDGIMIAVTNALATDDGTEADSDDETDDESGDDVDKEPLPVSDAEYENGTYVGSADGFNGPIELEVTVENNKISNVTILDHDETDGLSDPAFEEVTQAIIDTNSTDVDIVSGATLTSDGIIAAVDNALEAVAESDDDADLVYEDGTYTGTAEAHNGPIEVEVTIENGAIVDVTILAHDETDVLADPALEEIPAAIVENNSTDVDTISGVTVTSDAIIAAVDAILKDQAQ